MLPPIIAASILSFFMARSFTLLTFAIAVVPLAFEETSSSLNKPFTSLSICVMETFSQSAPLRTVLNEVASANSSTRPDLYSILRIEFL